MGNLLFLTHRLPYPPNKGDKVRSFHLLKHLAARHKVYLGTFIDDPDDVQHLPAVRALCADVHAPLLRPLPSRVASLTGLLRQQPLTLAYYKDASLARWVSGLQEQGQVKSALVFSSSMAQYANGFDGSLLVDFVDVDSVKWRDYAPAHRWPMSWLYRREGRLLLDYERAVAQRAVHSFFATTKEAALFRSLAPESGARVSELGNGVDADYFSPQPDLASPFDADETALVFTGAMDYWPNIDAVCWFVSDMLPALRSRWPGLRFHIVGRSPSAAVRALAGPAVNVTGTVPDVRPYLQHAAVVVAPLRLARGIQNKVLEAMAMGRAVVAAAECVEAINAQPGQHLFAAVDAADFVRIVAELISAPAKAAAVGHAARQQTISAYGWPACLAELDHHLARDPHLQQPQ
jgi:polysaccharide biosynthesis protein PslH